VIYVVWILVKSDIINH